MQTKWNQIHRTLRLLIFPAALLLGADTAVAQVSPSVTVNNKANNPVPIISIEQRTPYSNTIGGLLCGTSAQNQCTVPVGKQLVIEHVSGFIFKSPSGIQTTSTSMVVTDPKLGLQGAGFHIFLATKIDGNQQLTDVYVFGSPFKMVLSPKASYFFSNVAGISVSGYLIKSP
ncbi:MAG: hypothetical protein WCA07_09300 [Gloeobacterales cyanobacterium]